MSRSSLGSNRTTGRRCLRGRSLLRLSLIVNSLFIVPSAVQSSWRRRGASLVSRWMMVCVWPCCIQSARLPRKLLPRRATYIASSKFVLPVPFGPTMTVPCGDSSVSNRLYERKLYTFTLEIIEDIIACYMAWPVYLSITTNCFQEFGLV